MASVIEMIWGEWEAEYFCGGDWTGRNSLIRLEKFGCARTWSRPGGAPENPESEHGCKSTRARGCHCSSRSDSAYLDPVYTTAARSSERVVKAIHLATQSRSRQKV